MSEKNTRYRIFISAAEPSADAHCAGLITALQKSGYNIEFVGVGGPKMAEAGCELLEQTVTKAAMIYNAFSQVGYYYKLIKRISRFLRSNKVDLVIVCDSPSFNFRVAKAAKKASIRTLFYVAPQLWAWAGWRIRKLRRLCNKLCCILPFEQDWFSEKGIDATFVGNPLLDELQGGLRSFKKDYADFDPGRKLKIALMPGSRPAEIDSLWIPMQQIAMRIKEKYPAATYVTVAVDAGRKEILKAAQIPDFDCQYAISTVSDTAATSDFTLVASGSATLQVAAVGCPMVIMYQSSRILWHLVGRWLVKTKYLSLVNILAGKEPSATGAHLAAMRPPCRRRKVAAGHSGHGELVPEFMPYFSSIEPIVQSIEKLIEDRDKLAHISSELIKLAEPLAAKPVPSAAVVSLPNPAEGNASEEVSKIVVEMVTG